MSKQAEARLSIEEMLEGVFDAASWFYLEITFQLCLKTNVLPVFNQEIPSFLDKDGEGS